jgi:uncharacterized protein YcbK (DUF882 family)
MNMLNRRTTLLGLAASAVTLADTPAWSGDNPPGCVWPPPGWQQNGFPSRRWVNVVFVPTNETFKDIYVEDGKYSRIQVEKFSHVCRDYQANEWKFMDPRLLDLLFILHWKYCIDGEIQILSGYRSRSYQPHLERPVLDEQHVQARALDIRLPGVNNEELSADLFNIVYGGVSSFPALSFVHVDMGALRRSVEHSGGQANQNPERVALSKEGASTLFQLN